MTDHGRAQIHDRWPPQPRYTPRTGAAAETDAGRFLRASRSLAKRRNLLTWGAASWRRPEISGAANRHSFIMMAKGAGARMLHDQQRKEQQQAERSRREMDALVSAVAERR